jgi:serine/threonine protein kinase
MKKLNNLPDNVPVSNDKETEILTNLAHPNLIQLLTAFYHGKDYYMVFPKARGSLREIFQKEQYTGNVNYLAWLLRQLPGLAGGLNRIHTGMNNILLPVPAEGDKVGLHGDIAAANILVMDALSDLREDEYEFGRLQISDFGIGKLMDKRLAISVVSDTNRGQAAYAPPETEIRLDGSAVQSRWRDIWCFGCVMFEICMWLLEGKESMATFSSQR